MPSYNHGLFIAQAVKSVLEQSYPELELIVVDNKSSDNTLEALSAFSDPRLKIVIFENKGVIAASRNRGIKEASGEYVAFIDSDDIWAEDKLARQLEAFFAAPDAVLAYSRFRTITGDRVSDEVFPRLELCASGSIFADIYLRQFLACSGIVVKREVLSSIGGFDENPDLFALEDTDLWLKFAKSGRVVLSGTDPLFTYRLHPSGNSSGVLSKYKRGVALLWRHRDTAGGALFLKGLFFLTGSLLKLALFNVFLPGYRCR